MTRWLAVPAIAVVVAALISLSFLLASNTGARFLLRTVEGHLPVAFETVEGTFGTSLRFGKLQIELEQQQIEFRDLLIRPRWSCVFIGRLCFEALSAQSVEIALDNAPKDSEPAALRLPDMPSLQIDSLDIASFELASGGETLLIGRISSQVQLRDHSATLINASLGLNDFVISGDASFSNTVGLETVLILDTTSASALASLPALQSVYTVDVKGDEQRLTFRILESRQNGLSAEGFVTNLLSDTPSDFAGSLQGWSELFPVIAEQGVNPRGALRFSGERRGTDGTLSLHQDVEALGQTALASVDLHKVGVRLELAGAAWGAESASMIAVAGPLGELSNLQPELSFTLSDFPLAQLTEDRLAAISGDGQLAFSVTEPNNTWRLQSPSIHLRGKDLAVQAALDLAADPRHHFLPVGRFDASVDGRRVIYQRAQRESAEVSLPEGLAWDDFVLSTVSLRVDPAGEAWTDGAQVQANLEGDVEAKLILALQTVEEDLLLSVEPFSMAVQGPEFRTTSVLQTRWDKTEAVLRVDPFCVAYRQSSACARAFTLGESGEVSLDIDLEDSLELSREVSRLSLSANGSGELLLSWAEREPKRARFQAQLEPVELIADAAALDRQVFRWDSAELEAEWTPSGSRANLALESEDSGRLRLQLREAAGELEGRADLLGFDIASFAELAPSVTELTGRLTAAIDVSGSLERPKLAGSAELMGVSGGIQGTTMSFANGSLSVSAKDDRFIFEGEAGVGGGELKVSGVCCDKDRAEATLSGKRLALDLPSGVNATVSPQLFLVADRDLLDVSGVYVVHDGVLEHAGPREEGVALSRDIVLDQGVESDVSDFAISADIQTIIEPGFTLRSKELEATLSGDLRVSRRPRQAPELYGDLQVLGGELRAYGQALRIARGSVGFVGDPYNPELNVSAEREIRAERLRVGFKVLGSLDAPRLEMFSDPQRSERETLSYLLRGRGPDAGASADGTALALSLGASALNQSGALASLNDIPGLSGVTLGAEGSDDDVAATISAYVGNRLYLSYGVGIYEPVNALTARLYLRSRLWLEVVSRLESSFDLYYRFDRE
ncbi:MAG: hypothetical protein Cons2KO_17280 [Congregibacter sp.]